MLLAAIRAPARVVAVGSMLVLTGCGGDDAPQGLACDTLTFSTASAQPLDLVPIRGVSGGLAPLLAEVRVSGSESPGFMPMELDSLGQWSFVVPPHPNGTLEGGPVDVVVTDGETRCPSFAFRVAPLDPAPGAFREVIAGLQRQLEVRARLFGYTPEELVHLSPQNVPAPVVPLLFAQAYLDHPGNARAISGLLGATGDVPLVDALWAKSGLDAAVGTTVGTLEESAPFFIAASLQPARRSPYSFASFTPATAVEPSSSPEFCPGPASFYRPTAEELDRMMTNALRGDIATSGKAKHTYAAFLFTLGTGAAIPVKGVREAFVSSLEAAVIYKHVMEGFAKLLPRRFTDMEYDLTKSEFLEDDAAPGELSNIRVTAMSEGWNLDQNVATFVAETFAGELAGKIAGTFIKQAEGVYKESLKGAEDVAKVLFEEMLKEGVKPKPGAPSDTGGTIQMGPCIYGPTDVSDPEWSDIRYTGRAVQSVLESKGTRYEPVDVGVSAAVVSTPPKRFGFQLARLEKEIRVLPIRVIVEPEKRIVKAGEDTWFRVVVADALDGEIDVALPAGKITEARRYGGAPGEHYWRIAVRAPEEEARFTARVTAISTADRSHLRAVRDRVGEGRLVLRALQVKPGRACLQNGETVQFSAEVGGEPVEDVGWGGAGVSSSGSFRAPAEGNGTARVTAVDRNDSGLRGEAEVSYGEQCNSRFSFTTRGDINLEEAGGPLWGVGGAPADGLCLVSIPFVKKGDASEATMSLSAALPEGLKSGRYPIGRNYTGRAVGHDGRSYLEIPMGGNRETERASPGTFFAQIAANVKHSQARDPRVDPYSFPFDFTSSSGSVEIRRLEGNRIEITFEAEMIETESEWEQVLTHGGTRVENVHHPLRSLTVEGQLTHTLQNAAVAALPDVYFCERLDPVP